MKIVDNLYELMAVLEYGRKIESPLYVALPISNNLRRE